MNLVLWLKGVSLILLWVILSSTVASNTDTADSNAKPIKNSLCAAAASAENYSGAFLKSFKTLQLGEHNWLFRDMDLKRAYGPRAPGYKSLQQLQQLLQIRGIRLVMVPIPGRALVHPEYLGEIDYDIQRGRKSYSQYLEQLRSIDIVVPQIDSLFQQTQTKPLFFARDHHWNHHGARTIARLTAYAIKAEKIAGIKRQKFTSYSVGGDHNDGSLQRAALELCEQSYPKEPFKLYQTVAKSKTADDLFEELPEPQIVLVGTSNSQGRLKFNFDGFLAHYVGTAVDNKAKSGGGFGDALKEYLSSDEFKQSPPRIIVWEIPGYYSLNEPAFFADLLQGMETQI
jgi:alginate biosynthesis protein AlgX